MCSQIENLNTLSRAGFDEINHAVDGRTHHVCLLVRILAHVKADDDLCLVAELDLT